MNQLDKKAQMMEALKGKIIVSCQALEDEPLHGSFIMGRMAVAAKEGGAAGIRANSPQDIVEIKKAVDLPVIGLYKNEYPDSEVYITPTMKEIDALMEAKPDIIALDATSRIRPNGLDLETLFYEIKRKYPTMYFMADCATFAEGLHAQAIGFDFVGTTLCGYTKDTKGEKIPNLKLLKELTTSLNIPIIAEGGIWEVADVKAVFEQNIFAAVIGTAITRPREITKRFVSAIEKEENANTQK